MPESRPFFVRSPTTSYDFPPAIPIPISQPSSTSRQEPLADTVFPRIEQSARPRFLEEQLPLDGLAMSTSPERRRRMQRILQNMDTLNANYRHEDFVPVVATPSSFAAAHNLAVPSSVSARSLADPSTVSARSLANPGGRFRRLRRNRTDGSRDVAESTQGGMAQLHEATERLTQVNEDLRNLLAIPIDGVDNANGSTRTRPYVHYNAGLIASEERLHKRRRITGRKPFGRGHAQVAYGYNGQVVPTRLRMEIVSSDGGMMDTNSTNYGAKNVLREDLSVYCTKSSKCNMILCHEGEASFCMEKLVIKAPKSGYSHPVTGGLVFVSMARNEKFNRTACYQIPDAPIASQYDNNQEFRHDYRPYHGELRAPAMRRYPAPQRFDGRGTMTNMGATSVPDDASDSYDTEEGEADRAADEMQNWLTPGLAFQSPRDDSGGGDLEPQTTTVHGDFDALPIQRHWRDRRDVSSGQAQTVSGSPIQVTRSLPGDTIYFPDSTFNSQHLRDPQTAALAFAIDSAASTDAQPAPIWARPSTTIRHRDTQRRSETLRYEQTRDNYTPTDGDYLRINDAQDSQLVIDEIIRRGNAAATDRRRRRRRRERLDRERERARVNAAGVNVTLPPVSTVLDLVPLERMSLPFLEAGNLEMLEPVAKFSMDQERWTGCNGEENSWEEIEDDDDDWEGSGDEGLGIGLHNRTTLGLENYGNEHAQNHDSASDDQITSPLLPDAKPNSQPSPQHRQRQGQRLQPHQRQQTRHTFQTTTTSHDLAIHFNPPVSARYILLKLWSSKPDDGGRRGNIDIQGIEVEGFAGPRFFVAVEGR